MKHMQHCVIAQSVSGKHYDRKFPKNYNHFCKCWCHN